MRSDMAGCRRSASSPGKLELVALLDDEHQRERRAQPMRTRRRGCSPGALVLRLAECQRVGGAFFDHLAHQRADTAGAGLHAVAEVPSPPAALQNAKRFSPRALPAVERAMSQAGERLDAMLGRAVGEPVRIDLAATQTTVYGRGKEGAARCPTGEMSCARQIAFWVDRGRALTAELVGGNQERLSGRSTHGSRCARSVCSSRARGGHVPRGLRVLRDRAARALQPATRTPSPSAGTRSTCAGGKSARSPGLLDIS